MSKRILLGASASAALHKACDLASQLAQEGHEVKTLLTPRAAQLVSPQLFEALTGEPAWVDEFGDSRRRGMDHIDLSQWAQAICIAPASADLCSRLALGLANDLLTTTALALDRETPRVLCPAMNVHMLGSPPIVRNLETLRTDGWRILEPGEGHLACSVEGRGRLSEPEDIKSLLVEVLG